jgi:hypothetical protein
MKFSSLILALFAAVAVAAPKKNNDAAAAANADNAQASFGACSDPTISFKLGRPGRKATEGTFLPNAADLANGQGDALNPNIITNEVCDRIKDKSKCPGANAAAEALCLKGKALVASLGTKDSSTADAFNKALGF